MIPGTLILQQGPNGWHGSMHVGTTTLDVTAWHKNHDTGVVHFQIQHDEQWAAFMERLTAKVSG